MDRMPMDGAGCTGYAASSEEMAISITPSFSDRHFQMSEIRPIVFHEGYHMSEGFHYEAGIFSALECAVYEGKAVRFECDYADSTPLYSNWKDEVDKLDGWYAAIKSITAEQYFEPTGETWRKWAFWDSETKDKWRIYKTGTWIVDTVMEARGLTAIDLHGMPPSQIIEWFDEARSKAGV